MERSASNVNTNIVEMEGSFGINSYGISVTTLEEVFLRVVGYDYDGVECLEPEEGLQLSGCVAPHKPCVPTPQKVLHQNQDRGNCKKILGIVSAAVGDACALMLAAVFTFISFLSMLCCNCCIISRSTFCRHFKAMFIKRMLSARRDQKTIVFQLLLPAVFLTVGLLFLKLKPHPDQQPITFTTSHFNPLLSGGGGGGPIPFNLSWPIAKEVCFSLFMWFA